jgi:lipopolysaccharide/colanic/teichoic acid biosynthesis glycosyltransferase
MATLVQKNITAELTSNKPGNFNRHHSFIPFQQNTLFLNESQFKALFVRERKRAERTKSPMLLAIVDVSVLKVRGMSNHLMHAKIKEGFISCSREIDLRGWYREEYEMGILFTDIKIEAVQSIMDKLLDRIASMFGPNLSSAVTVRHLVYPLDVSLSPLETDADRAMLYPEVEASSSSSALQRGLKRTVDLALSVTALIALSPLFAVIAALIKLSSPGPVFFNQERLGYGGKRFKLLKFRSMKPDCETDSHKQYVLSLINRTAVARPDSGFFKMKNDPRVTAIGRLLRKTSLDELPQLMNVLRGDMSLVGPRPPIAYEVEAYAPWHQRRLLEAVPGITGLWQVEGRSRTSFDDMVRMDIRYSKRWNLWLDMKLLLMTPAAVFIGKGAS